MLFKFLRNYPFPYVIIVITALNAITILWIGFHYHIIEDWQNNNPELDFYSQRAIGFFSGQMIPDPFRPQGYLLLTSLLNVFINDAFMSAKIISMISGIVFFVIIGKISQVLFNPKVALASLFLLACSPFLVKASVRAASDMLFWCLLAQAIYFFIVYLRQETSLLQRKLLFACGLFLGCALSVRYTALFGLLSVGLILLVNEIRVIKRQGSITLITQYLTRDYLRLVLLPLGVMIGFLPAAVINIATFGKPYYSENWRNIFYSLIIYLRDTGTSISSDLDNLAFNLAQINDIEKLTQQYPGIVWYKTVYEFLNLINGVASYFSMPSYLAWGFLFLGLAYMIKKSSETLENFSCNLPHLFSLSFTLIFLIFSALTFFLYERFVVLPVTFILVYAIGLIHALPQRLFWISICFLCFIQLPLKYQALNAFAQSHLLSNVKAIEKINLLTKTQSKPHTVIGTNLYLSYRSRPSYINYAPIPLLVTNNQIEYCAGLSQLMSREDPHFVLVGSISPNGYLTPSCEHLFQEAEWSVLRFDGEHEHTKIYVKSIK